jgi:hyaluronoglucosaminidase
MFKWIKDIYVQGPTLQFDHWHVDSNQKIITSQPKVMIEEILDPMLNDRFQCHFYSDYTLRIRFGNNRAKQYAYHALQTLILPIQVGIYEGGPDFIIRGIIEGFYGTPWSHDDRMDMIQFIEAYHMNSYFYAPKDDKYHRELWRTPYPEQELNRLLELVRLSKKHHVDFYFCISPGNDFDYTKTEEFTVLFNKLDQLLENGVHHFALLLDDIDYVLKGDSLIKFERPGVAHAYITNQVNRYLSQKNKAYQFVMCPTEYAQNVNSSYREDLALGMDKEVKVFWTGYNTVAEYIPNLDGERAKTFFNHPLVLWDNYPVNDMAKDRLFMGPIRNRGKQLHHTHVGMVSNPMVEWHISKLPIITMALYMWDVSGYNPDLAYLYALKCMVKKDESMFEDFKTFADENYDSLIYERTDDLYFSIENNDFNTLERYYKNLHKAISSLKNSLFDVNLTHQAQPWFDRGLKDIHLFNQIINKEVNKEDFDYILKEKHTLGRNVVLHLGIKMGYIKHEEAPKKRTVFWELKAPQL